MIVVLLQSVIKNIWMAKVLSDNQKKVQTMKIEKASLIQQLEESRTEFFVEKIAREKLDMLKSGEIILKLQSDK
jgi:cell division protein FtsB